MHLDADLLSLSTLPSVKLWNAYSMYIPHDVSQYQETHWSVKQEQQQSWPWNHWPYHITHHLEGAGLREQQKKKKAY